MNHCNSTIYTAHSTTTNYTLPTLLDGSQVHASQIMRQYELTWKATCRQTHLTSNYQTCRCQIYQPNSPKWPKTAMLIWHVWQEKAQNYTIYQLVSYKVS